MITLYVILLVAAHCLSTTTSTAIANGPNKRSENSYAVEGCFSSFVAASGHISLGFKSSNARCQDFCRDKGYILAATQGKKCYCGNIYPRGKRIAGSKCSTKCRSYTACHDPQSCCGGPNAYTVSVVGNIDVPKQILRRLAHVWQTVSEFRNEIKSQLKIPEPQSHNADWSSSLEHRGWSTCGKGRYMTGMWRNHYYRGDERLGRIEEARCYDAASHLFSSRNDWACYEKNVRYSFNDRRWELCRNGFYMNGIYKSSGSSLDYLDRFHCCKPKYQEERWGECYNHNAWASFDRIGWTECKKGYYMAGLFRNSCDQIGCLEEFKCCKMGKYNGLSNFLDKPNLVINITDTSGKLKQCSMNAMDKTPESKTFSCKAISNPKNILKLEAMSFNIEDKTALSVAEPKNVPGFRPVICPSHPNAYTCTKSLSTKISTTSSFTIGSGVSSSVSIGASVEVGTDILGVSVSTAFSTEVTSSSSFNVERSTTKTTETDDNTQISIAVPKNTEIKIDLKRTVEDTEYKWKAVFKLLGKYSIKWNHGLESSEDVTTVLSGPAREMFAFGSWKYPGTDVLRAIITGKYGDKKASGCDHKPGEGKSCKIKV